MAANNAPPPVPKSRPGTAEPRPKDFAGPPPPPRPNLKSALDQKAAQEAVRQMLGRAILDGLIGLRLEQQGPPPPPPQKPRQLQSERFPWTI